MFRCEDSITLRRRVRILRFKMDSGIEMENTGNDLQGKYPGFFLKTIEKYRTIASDSWRCRVGFFRSLTMLFCKYHPSFLLLLTASLPATSIFYYMKGEKLQLIACLTAFNTEILCRNQHLVFHSSSTAFTRLFIILILELFCFYFRAISFSLGCTGVIIQCFDFGLFHCEVFYGDHSNSNNSFEIDLCLYAIYARFSLLKSL